MTFEALLLIQVIILVRDLCVITVLPLLKIQRLWVRLT